MTIRQDIIQQVMVGVLKQRISIVEGAIGSGKSVVLTAVRQELGDTHDCFLILAGPESEQIPYAPLAHLISSVENAYAEFLITLDRANNPVIIIENIDQLDDSSRRLLLWAIEQRGLGAVISCHQLETQTDLIELLAQGQAHRITLPPLTKAEISAVLRHVWEREPKPWQVAAAARYTQSNLLAVNTLACFVKENMFDAPSPVHWQEHFLTPFNDSHTSLRAYSQRLRLLYGNDVMNAAQRLTVVGPCAVGQAVDLVGAPALEKLDSLGLLEPPGDSCRVQLGNDLLELSLWVEVLDGADRQELHLLINEQLAFAGYEPPAAQVVWWQQSGMRLPYELLVDTAQRALTQGYPNLVHLLLKDQLDLEARWLKAEALVITGSIWAAQTEAKLALDMTEPTEPVPTNHAMICIATGLWPIDNPLSDAEEGLELCAAALVASGQGKYHLVLQIVAQVPPGVEVQIWQNLMSLAALAEAMLGQGNEALTRIKNIGQIAATFSSLTRLNIDNALYTVLFLNGQWNDLREELERGFDLHGIWDRNGLDEDLAVLMNLPSGVPLEPLKQSIDCPLGFLQLRELAHLITEQDENTTGLSVRIDRLASNHGTHLPPAVALIYRMWALRLSAEHNGCPDLDYLRSIQDLTTGMTSRLAQILQLYVRAHNETNPKLDQLARAQAKQAGVLHWLPEPVTMPVTSPREYFGELSDREFEISALAAAGARSQQIAAELGLSVRTVETHLRNVYRKLKIGSRHELSSRFLASAEKL